jgi:hypothetical protein
MTINKILFSTVLLGFQPSNGMRDQMPHHPLTAAETPTVALPPTALDVDKRQNPVMIVLKNIYGRDIKGNQLYSITLAISNLIRISGVIPPEIPPKDRHNVNAILNFLEDHYSLFMPFLQNMHAMRRRASPTELRRSQYGLGLEAIRIMQATDGLDVDNGPAREFIEKTFGKITLRQLISIIQCGITLANKDGCILPQLTRLQKRDTTLLYNYINNHLYVLQTILPSLTLRDTQTPQEQ